MLPVLYEMSEAMQTAAEAPWRDPANWPMVLPNLGRSIELPRLVELYDQAREKGDAAERLWASQHLNVQIGLALHTDRWRGADYWLKAAEPGLSLEEIMDRSEVCTVGIDTGGLDDLFGLAVIGRCKETGRWLAWCHAWCHESVLQRRKEIAPTLKGFEADGDLTVCPSGQTMLREVTEIVGDLRDAGLLPAEGAVGCDTYMRSVVIDELAAFGIVAPQLAAVQQSTKLSPAIWGVEWKLEDGTLRHGGQPIMAWCVGNAKAEQKGNAVSINKQESGKAKIDPLLALFAAYEMMARNPEAAGGSLDDFLSAPVTAMRRSA